VKYPGCLLMSKEEKNTIVPKLRFSEFIGNGEWSEKSLGDVLIKNSTKNKDLKYSLVESVSNKFGFIKQDEYFENRIVASKDTSNYYIIKKGYFAYNPSRIDVGSLAYKHDDKVSIISPLYVSFKANNSIIDDYFLLCFFKTIGFTRQMIFEGGVRNTLNYENLIQIKISVPTLSEQQKIADCLLSLDDLITAENQKLEALKARKKGLMQQLFPAKDETVPRLRFEEFNESGEWEEKTLKDVCQMQAGKFVSASEINETKEDNLFPCYGGNGLRGYTTSFTHAGNYSLIGRQGALCGNVILVNGKFHATEHAVVVTPKQNVDTAWLYYMLVRLNLNQYATGQAQPGLSVDNLEKVALKISKSKEEQQKIVDCLSSVDELITTQAEKIATLNQHKKGLMQGLFPNNNNLLLEK